MEEERKGAKEDVEEVFRSFAAGEESDVFAGDEGERGVLMDVLDAVISILD